VVRDATGRGFDEGCVSGPVGACYKDAMRWGWATLAVGAAWAIACSSPDDEQPGPVGGEGGAAGAQGGGGSNVGGLGAMGGVGGEAPPGCADGMRNDVETDIDCGGPECAPCVHGRACNIALDCESQSCVGFDDDQRCMPRHLFSARFGDADEDQSVTAAAMDASGVMLLSGSFDGSVDFGGGALQDAGYGDAFMVALTAEGGFAWAHQLGTPSSDSIWDMASAGDGGMVAVGTLEDPIDLGTGLLPVAGFGDALVVRYDVAGVPLYAHTFGGSEPDAFGEVAVHDGRATFGGHFEGDVDFGLGVLEDAGESDIVVGQLDEDGDTRWARNFGAASSERVEQLVVDVAGDVVMAGHYDDTIDFGGGALPDDPQGYFLAKLSGEDGAHRWSRTLPIGFVQLVVGDDLHPVIAGGFARPIDFGLGELVPRDGGGSFVAKIDGETGETLWNIQLEASLMALDTDGSTIWLAGSSDAGIDLGGAEPTIGIFAVELTSDGTVARSFAIPATSPTEIAAIDVQGDDVFLAGDLRGVAILGGPNLINVGSDDDVFVARFSLR
jgi:outer membrane protein assembly factor BamB